TKSSLSRCFRLCGVRWGGAASFAAARTISRNPKLFKFAATGASGFFPVCAGALPLFKRGVRPQRGNGGGHPCHGRGSLSHSGSLPAPGGGDELYESQAERQGRRAPSSRLGVSPAG